MRRTKKTISNGKSAFPDHRLGNSEEKSSSRLSWRSYSWDYPLNAYDLMCGHSPDIPQKVHHSMRGRTFDLDLLESSGASRSDCLNIWNRTLRCEVEFIQISRAVMPFVCLTGAMPIL